MIPRTRLPQELIDNIVVELAGDWRSLEACSVVASSFRDVCQKTLFRAVTLDLDVRFKGAHARLRDAFISNVHLGGHVKLLHLKTSDDMASPDILLMMPNLQTLDITGGGRRRFTGWSSIPDQIQTGVLSICLLSTLVKLRMQRIFNFPLAILRKCPQLRDLQIPDGLQDARELSSELFLPNDQLRNSHSPPQYLESLTAFTYTVSQQISTTLAHPTSSLSLSRLRKYNSEIVKERSIIAFQAMLDFAADTLVITHAIVFNEVTHSMHLDLSRLKNLRRVGFSTPGESLSHSMEWGRRVLETIPEGNRVETVFFTLAGPPIREDMVIDLDRAVWGRIDDLLTQKRYSALRHVVVNSAGNTFGIQGDVMLDQIMEAMPKLGAKGLTDDLRVYINESWE